MGRAGSSPAPAINECGEPRGPSQEAGGMELAAGRWGRRVDCWELSLGPEAAESLVRDRGQWAEVVALWRAGKCRRSCSALAREAPTWRRIVRSRWKWSIVAFHRCASRRH